MISQVMRTKEAFEFLQSLSVNHVKDLPNPWHGSMIHTDGVVVVIEDWGYLTGKHLVSIYDRSELQD